MAVTKPQIHIANGDIGGGGGGGGLDQLIGDVNAGPGTGTQTATIAPDAVTNTKLANMTQATLKGRASGAGTGDPTDLTADQSSTVLDGAADPFRRTSSLASVTGSLIGIQVITTTGAGTYTPTANTASIIMELLGAGGGGSGVASAGVNQVNLGGGGGAGAWVWKRLTANFSGASYSVGAKGTGGTAGDNNGTDGGNTTFTDTAGSPTTYTAAGGVKGVPRTSFAPPITNIGGVGGTGTNGTLNIPGSDGFGGIAPNQFVGYASGGGASHYGPYTPSALVINAASSAGPAGTGKGTGGSGAVSSNAGGAAAGGNGADGMIIIYEFR